MRAPSRFRRMKRCVSSAPLSANWGEKGPDCSVSKPDRTSALPAPLHSVAEGPARPDGGAFHGGAGRLVGVVVDHDHGDVRLAHLPERLPVQGLQQRGEHARAAIGRDADADPRRRGRFGHAAIREASFFARVSHMQVTTYSIQKMLLRTRMVLSARLTTSMNTRYTIGQRA